MGSLVLLAHAALLLPSASCSSTVDAGAAQPGSASGDQGERSELSERFHREVNRYRAQQGKEALPRHRGLDQLAREHALYLRDNRGRFHLHGSSVSHFGFKSRSQRAKVAYGFSSVGENVAGGQRTVGEVVAALAQSPNHRHSMLNSWSSTGCAVVAAADGALFSVQLFGSLSVPESQRWREHLVGY